MNTDQLITYCREQGITFFLGDKTIRVYGTASAIEKVLPILQANKKEIFKYLLTVTSSNSPDSFDDDTFLYMDTDAKKALEETRTLLKRIMSRHV